MNELLLLLKNISWKRHGLLLWNVCRDFKVLGLIFLIITVLYNGMIESIIKPSFVDFGTKDAAITEQQNQLEKTRNLRKDSDLSQVELQKLETTIASIPAGNAATVVSVSEAAELLALAQGQRRDNNILPLLQPPYDHRDNVTLTPTHNQTINLLKPDEETTSTTSTSPPAHIEGVVDNTPEGPKIIPVQRYDYDLKMTGTYASIMDLLNELVIYKKLILINKILIEKSPSEVNEPDAKDVPDYPLKLDLTLSLSLFLSDQNAGNS